MPEIITEKELSPSQKISDALSRNQTWLTLKIREYSDTLPESHPHKDFFSRFTDVKLSRRMKGRDDFEDYLLEVIAMILGVNFN